jgi:hypothetical protein
MRWIKKKIILFLVHLSCDLFLHHFREGDLFFIASAGFPCLSSHQASAILLLILLLSYKPLPHVRAPHVALKTFVRMRLGRVRVKITNSGSDFLITFWWWEAKNYWMVLGRLLKFIEGCQSLKNLAETSIFNSFLRKERSRFGWFFKEVQNSSYYVLNKLNK